MHAAATKFSDTMHAVGTKSSGALHAVVLKNSVGKSPLSRGTVYTVCVLSLICTLVGILALNVRISSSQYHFVQLSAQAQALTQENEALTQELQFANAPQNLAKRAANLGMTPSTEFGTIDLDSNTVAGDPRPAEEPGDDDKIIIDTAHGAPEVKDETSDDKDAQDDQDAPEVSEAVEEAFLTAPRQRTPGTQE